MTYYWKDLKTDILVLIFDKLDIQTLTNTIPLVCKFWKKAVDQALIHYCRIEFGINLKRENDYTKFKHILHDPRALHWSYIAQTYDFINAAKEIKINIFSTYFERSYRLECDQISTQLKSENEFNIYYTPHGIKFKLKMIKDNNSLNYFNNMASELHFDIELDFITKEGECYSVKLGDVPNEYENVITDDDEHVLAHLFIHYYKIMMNKSLKLNKLIRQKLDWTYVKTIVPDPYCQPNMSKIKSMIKFVVYIDFFNNEYNRHYEFSHDNNDVIHIRAVFQGIYQCAFQSFENHFKNFDNLLSFSEAFPHADVSVYSYRIGDSIYGNLLNYSHNHEWKFNLKEEIIELNGGSHEASYPIKLPIKLEISFKQGSIKMILDTRYRKLLNLANYLMIV